MLPIFLTIELPHCQFYLIMLLHVSNNDSHSLCPVLQYTNLPTAYIFHISISVWFLLQYFSPFRYQSMTVQNIAQPFWYFLVLNINDLNIVSNVQVDIFYSPYS